ncbi:MAG: adenosylcobinamide-GDP ribazoletransferase [Rhodobacteraceae bacterium]|nr:MAG: adenosylcobinamide-GDP ribazoletransferase [Paracoccaceae bacterium]
MPNSDTRAQFLDLAVAFALLTRLPLPHLPDSGFANQARAGWAFGLVGAVVGLIAGVVGLFAMWLGLPDAAAAGLALMAMIVVSGAMHEDGLADTVDGLWGGWTVERRLEIMKDSAIGTYGVLALIMSLGLRWGAIAELLPHGIGPLIAAGAVSRGLLPAVMAALPHARRDGLARSVGAPDRRVAIAAAAVGGGLALVVAGVSAVLLGVLAAIGVALVARIARAKIGGQTGDILGACQQAAEITVLLGLVALK